MLPTSEFSPLLLSKLITKFEVAGAVKCEYVKVQSNGHVDDQLRKNFGELKLKYEKLKIVFSGHASCYLCT
jgi:hypothetical protein